MEKSQYDSNFKELEFHPSLTHQLAAKYKPLVECFDEEGDRIDLNMGVDIVYVQVQKGAADCDPFAIAYYH